MNTHEHTHMHELHETQISIIHTGKEPYYFIMLTSRANIEQIKNHKCNGLSIQNPFSLKSLDFHCTKVKDSIHDLVPVTLYCILVSKQISSDIIGLFCM